MIELHLVIAEKSEAQDFRPGVPDEDGTRKMGMLVSDHHLQSALDNLQGILSTQSKARIIVLPVETSLPQVHEEKRKEEDSAITHAKHFTTGLRKGHNLIPIT